MKRQRVKRIHNYKGKQKICCCLATRRHKVRYTVKIKITNNLTLPLSVGKLTRLLLEFNQLLFLEEVMRTVDESSSQLKTFLDVTNIFVRCLIGE